MAEFGYALSSEEHTPQDLVQLARRAEEVGFSFALISDHYHPWIDAQGHSPFVWSVIGGIAQVTEKLRLGTGVTCPTIRIHPAIMAQAAATSAAMMPGRFFFGIGTGENLNEHILGERWPPYDIRLEMLIEAVDVIRELWSGEEVSFWGDFYVVENARLYTLPDELPPIMVAAAGDQAAEAAGEIGDGLISTSPERDVIRAFEQGGGQGKPKYGQVTVCWARTKEEAVQTAYEIWPNAGLTGQLTQELATPAHFEGAIKMVTPEDVAKKVICGPDAAEHLKAIHKFLDAGYDHVYIHQVGHDQEGFFHFYEQEILPELQQVPVE